MIFGQNSFFIQKKYVMCKHVSGDWSQSDVDYTPEGEESRKLFLVILHTQ